MTIEERNTKLKHFITCLKCEVSGRECDDNCPIKYEAGNMGEIIENLEAISKALEQEPCEDCISRQAVLDKKELVELEDGQSFYCISPEDVETLPSVNSQLKTGNWITSPNDYFVQCSECGLHGDKGIYKHYRWCPNCGAKMSEIPTGSESEDQG